MLLPRIFDDVFTNNDFDDFFYAPFATRRPQGVSQMHSDVRELDDSYEVDMNLPGYDKEDVTAELKDGYLTIEASHNEEHEEKNKEGKYLRRERYSGSLKRSFYVGEQVTNEDIKAKFKNGVLTVSIPKKEELPKAEEKKYIAIEG
ncbi:MAG: Hsp20/alpha crystallin family protein [Lachnospiraceae bacterium]|nr:Hsp20/alpha crystallin family protein [Lachnospiraceae bacterium]